MFRAFFPGSKPEFVFLRFHHWNWTIVYVPVLLAFMSSKGPLQAAPIEMGTVQTLVSQRKVAELKKLGQEVLPIMTRLYESSNEADRTNIAEAFYQLGWKSAEAKRVLMKDVHTQNQYLRLQVQWALGRVSNDVDVVEVLLSNMQNDSNPLFRDKAACALAYDQIHLTEKQKVRLYQGLIQSLRDSKPDVRRIALLALSIQTGQTKNFSPDAPVDQREAAFGNGRNGSKSTNPICSPHSVIGTCSRSPGEPFQRAGEL